jgi:hypothetical protein
MIEIGSWAPQAEEKLRKEKKDVSGQKEKAMADAVYAQIRDFCMQDEEFAQAVVQGDSFAECMKAVAKNVGNYISDVDAYQKAVQFYFPGAQIRLQMTIDLIGKAAENTPTPVTVPEKKPTLTLNLADFF